MLSRLKSSVKGVVRSLRGAPEVVAPAPVRAAPAPVRVPPPVEVPRPPVVAAPRPAPKVEPDEAAPQAEPVIAKAEPAKVAPKAEPAKAEPAKVEAVKAAPAVAAPAAEPEPVKKLSMAAMAAAAAAHKAPAARPTASSHDDDDDHHDEPVKKSTSLAAAAAAASGQTAGRMVRADMGSTDRAAYIARAIANNRDPKTIKGGEGRNIAEDGVAYMGPLDNESSRAKAAAQVITVDQFECISCGTCVEQTNRVFYLPVDGKATPIAQDGPMDLIQDAIEACPVTCIHWVDPAEAAEKGYATGVGEDWTEVIQSLPVD